MIRQEQIAYVIDSFNDSKQANKKFINREKITHIPVQESFATILSGVRRCGKSTLMAQICNSFSSNKVYINFEDIRLTGFDILDFNRLHNELIKRESDTIFLDEVQLIEGWEKYVNQLLREGFKVFITGSNATMLSRELGTSLTGRHLSYELFPFSYNEFLNITETQASDKRAQEYLFLGGFPEFVQFNNEQILTQLLSDILIRDIAVRYMIRDINSLKSLALYLLSNVGKPLSANNLKGLFGVNSTTTISEYISYMQDSYLIFIVPQFSYSLKSQNRNLKKIYAIDTGLVNVVSSSFSEDLGRKLENLVFLQLRRNNREIFYYKNKGECDFLVQNKEKIKIAIQVCYEISDLNFDRETGGLLEAMVYFDLVEGYIVSLNQKDSFEIKDRKIHLIPLNEFLLNF